MEPDPTLKVEALPVGSQVRVSGQGPFRGFRGTIRAVHVIAADLDEPFCFYLVALEGTFIKEPLWFEYREVELVALPRADS